MQTNSQIKTFSQGKEKIHNDLLIKVFFCHPSRVATKTDYYCKIQYKYVLIWGKEFENMFCKYCLKRCKVGICHYYIQMTYVIHVATNCN